MTERQLDGLLLFGGMFLIIAVGAPTADNGNYSLGIAICFLGMIFFFLSFEENRNLKRISQIIKYYWHNLKKCF